MDPDVAVLLTVLAGILALLCWWRSHVANRHYRLIDALPTSRVQGVFIGLVELKGTAEGVPFTSFLAERECLLYNWSVSEEWRRTVTETYQDSEGKTRTRTRTESGWSTVASGGESRPFYLQDDTGAVLIHPEGAEVRPFRLFWETVTLRDPLYYGKGPAGGVMDSTGVRRFVEDGIPHHAVVFIVGQARERQDMVAAEVAHAPGVPLYLVTTEEEVEVLKRYGRSRDGLGVLGLVLAVACGHGISLLQGIPPPWPHLLAAAVYLTGWGVTWVWMLYNSLVDVRNRVRQGWSLIEVQLKRRHDLIPSLVAAVEGLRLHEREVTEAVTDLRTQESATPSGMAGPDYHGTARRLAVLAESYPVLKTSDAFLRLQQALTETEQRLALARDYFNGIASSYNTRLEIFPDSLIARLSGFRAQPLLEAAGFERAAVPVTGVSADAAAVAGMNLNIANPVETGATPPPLPMTEHDQKR
jgi:hypothetical protein